jgi:protein-tyrosine phosphatase
MSEPERLWTRRLSWEACFNVRDLGGYPLPDGRQTRWGAVVRADTLSRLTPAGCAALVDYGVRTIIDLRRPRELEVSPNPFALPGPHDITYQNFSLYDPADFSLDVLTTLGDSYKRMFDRYASQIAAIMSAIARAAEGTVLVHCMGGQDRTGLISALLLELVGVARETVAADYALTAERFHEAVADYLENGPGDRAERERNLTWGFPRAEFMLDALTYLDAHHGGAEHYLLSADVSPTDIASLRRRLRGCLKSPHRATQESISRITAK